jgi:hypothetical protein
MKNLLLLSIGFASLLGFCAPLMSQQQEWMQPHFFTGAELLRGCDADISDGVSTGVCLGYITGVVDSSTGVETHAVLEDGTVILPLCLPDSLNNNQILRDIVTNFMRQHPDRLKQPAVQLIHMALKSFGCKTGWPVGVLPPTKKP